MLSKQLNTSVCVWPDTVVGICWYRFLPVMVADKQTKLGAQVLPGFTSVKPLQSTDNLTSRSNAFV